MKRLLVALDGSSRAPAVLSYAVSLASALGSKLLLFRSYNIPPDLSLAWPLADQPLEDGLRKQALAEVETLARAAPAEVIDGMEIALGVPWEAVCSAAKKNDVELIVIGSHGYAGVDLLLGTTAAKVVNHADRPVLVVRPIGGRLEGSRT